jgi:hypothetical protein
VGGLTWRVLRLTTLPSSSFTKTVPSAASPTPGVLLPGVLAAALPLGLVYKYKNETRPTRPMNTAQATKSRSWLLASSILDVGLVLSLAIACVPLQDNQKSIPEHTEFMIMSASMSPLLSVCWFFELLLNPEGTVQSSP